MDSLLFIARAVLASCFVTAVGCGLAYGLFVLIRWYVLRDID